MLLTCVCVCVLLQMTELNTLKKKQPTDLWKADLAAFTEELEVT